MNLTTRRRVLSAAALTGLTAAVGALAAVRRRDQARTAPRTIRIEAERFAYTPDHVLVEIGEPVVLELTSRDVVMGFNLPDFSLRADMIPGRITRVNFMPQTAGVFPFLCDVFCGSGHEEMEGRIEVVARDGLASSALR